MPQKTEQDDRIDLAEDAQPKKSLFIKRVAIKDFLTYRDVQVINVDGNMSPGLNVLLGKNGSGKSSLLKAIAYVLTDRFSSLTK